MGYMNNAYAAYQNTNIKTASQGKLIVLLYEGAVKNLSAAQSCFTAEGKVEAKNIEKFGNYVMKAQDIISELQASLDMEKGGQISTNLMSLYIYFNQELMSANISKDRKKLDFVLNMLQELSGAWNEAYMKSSDSTGSGIAGGLNIQG
jgi:flagellar protein FliS